MPASCEGRRRGDTASERMAESARKDEAVRMRASYRTRLPAAAALMDATLPPLTLYGSRYHVYTIRCGYSGTNSVIKAPSFSRSTSTAPSPCGKTGGLGPRPGPGASKRNARRAAGRGWIFLVSCFMLGRGFTRTRLRFLLSFTNLRVELTLLFWWLLGRVEESGVLRT